jgi:nucleoside-diphosphate kinase
MNYIIEHHDIIALKEIARHIRPRTLRALYGRDKVKNAVHCTDLAEDATLEVE